MIRLYCLASSSLLLNEAQMFSTHMAIALTLDCSRFLLTMLVSVSMIEISFHLKLAFRTILTLC